MAMNDLWLNKFQQEALPERTRERERSLYSPSAVAAQFRH